MTQRLFLASSIFVLFGCAAVDTESPGAAFEAEPIDPVLDLVEPDGEPLAACPVGQQCAPPIPAGWSGPVTMVTDPTGDVACPDEMPVQLELGFRDLEVDAMSCGCSCSRPKNLTCDADLILRTTSAVDCSDLTVFNPTKVRIPVGTTVDLRPLNGIGTTWFRDPNDGPLPDVTGGECTPRASHSFPEPELFDPILLCGADSDTPESCDRDGSCLPEMADSSAPICIYQEGDVDCPAASPFTERTVSYRDFEDTRACSDCSCGTPTGESACGATVAFSTPGTEIFDVADGCIELPERPILANQVTDVECPASPTTEFGAVEPAAAVTACCLPEH
jgi:hypothetical protein